MKQEELSGWTMLEGGVFMHSTNYEGYCYTYACSIDFFLDKITHAN
jgi:hypothetical protein